MAVLFFGFSKIFELSWLLFFWAPALSGEGSIRICVFSKMILLPRMTSGLKLFCNCSLLTCMNQRMCSDRPSKTPERDTTTLKFPWSRAASALDEMQGEKELGSMENISVDIVTAAWKSLIPRENK